MHQESIKNRCQIPRAKKYAKYMKKVSKTEPKILQKSKQKVIEIRAGPRDAQRSARDAAGPPLPGGRRGATRGRTGHAHAARHGLTCVQDLARMGHQVARPLRPTGGGQGLFG